LNEKSPIQAGSTINPWMIPKIPLPRRKVAKGGNIRISHGYKKTAATSVVTNAHDTGVPKVTNEA
jgi:hypothetical protein